MRTFTLYCEQFDFAPLAQEVKKEVQSDVNLAAEIIFVEGDEIRRLNREQRNIDDITDVLSFPTIDNIRGKKLKKREHIADIDEEGNLFLGSIVICTQRAEEQAAEYGHSYARELHYLAVHGVLHLLGYDHMTDEDKAEMRKLEEGVLSRLNLERN